MKTLITLSALGLIANLAVAGDFAYELQINSEDLASETSTLHYRSTNPAPSVVQPVISLHEIYRGNPDTETVPEGFQHSISGKMEALRESGYDILVRENPDLGV
ncbi:MAG TPA: hypothetical protein ENJ98_05640 [Thiolapillus brandeum]|uniref:Uncharacterized protein n=1 Tax=Thiolapillus brandeum TaxID=1076588 RepID=A0A7C5N0C1_9GAMM|nr:hypothetical protein [Thiolapillus brandeum]